MARRAFLGLAVALLALALAAPPGAAQTPKRGGVLRIAEREAPTLDPHLSISFLTHPQYISHQPSVKGFRHHDGYGMGLRLMHTWLDR